MALKRKFGTKWYYFDSQFGEWKSRAKTRAKKLREAGNLVRVAFVNGAWTVWAREK